MINRLFSQGVIFCISGLFILPFLWPLHTPPLATFYNEWIAAVLLLIACFLCVSISIRKDASIPFPFVAFLFAALIGVVAIQLNLGLLTYAYNALFPIILFALAIAAAILGSASVKIFGLEKLLTVISTAVILGGGLSFIAQVAQLYGLENSFSPWISKKINGEFYYANLSQPNQLSTYLSWSLICVLYLYAKKSINTLSGISLIAILLSAIALTGSRTSWLQITWIAAAGSYLIWKMESALRPRHWYFLIGLPILYMIVTLAFPYIGEFAHFSFGRSTLDRMQSETALGSRWGIYSMAWEIFFRNPIIGVGPGELGFRQFMLMDHHATTVLSNSAHNLILDLLSMMGMVGTIVFVGFLVSWFHRIRKMNISFEIMGILLMLTVLGIHSLLEYPEWYGFFLWPAAFFLGCLETKSVGIKSTPLLHAMLKGSTFLGLVLSIIFYFQYLQIETLYLRFNTHQDQSLREEAANIADVYSQTFFRAPAELLLCLRLPLNNIDLERKIEISRRVMRFNVGPDVIFRHIVWLGMANRQEEAIAYFSPLKKAYPKQFIGVAKEIMRLGDERPKMYGKMATAMKNLNSLN